MRRQLRLLVALLVLAVFPAAGGASPPDGYMSSADPVIVAGSGGSVIGTGYHVTLRNSGGIPLPGHNVELYFTGSGFGPYAAQDSGTTVDCATRMASRNTDFYGVATFYLRAGGFENGATVQVRGQGVLIATIPARSTDLNADGTTDIQDVARFRENLVGNRRAPETDFNLDGVTDIRDLAVLRSELVSGARGEICP